MKICTKCKKEKPEEEFSRNKESKDGLAYSCKACLNKYCKERYKKNPEPFRKATLKYARKNRFACSLMRISWKARQDGYAACNATTKELKAAYTGKCHACGIPELELYKKLHVDHCHKTGAFRGWLCEDCNHALGMMKDSLGRISALSEYLKRATVLTFQPQ